MGIDTLPPLREVIAEHGLSARKSLGQNFLLDLNLTSKIARCAGSLAGHDVLEIGPGPGGLTRALLAQGARRVVAVEKDERCIPALAQIEAAYPGRLTCVMADARTLNWDQHLEGPVKVVANLPYNVATVLLIRWLSEENWPPKWDSLTLMFQKEVAERLVAPVGTKAYGRLSLLSQWRADVSIAYRLPPDAFTPQPKVHSAVVHFKGKKTPLEADLKTLTHLIAAGFNQRRKMLRTSLKHIAPDMGETMIACDIDPTDRADQIDLARWCALARAIAARTP